MPHSSNTRRVLHIGVSYYNNEYLAESLRDLGWEVDIVVSSGEAVADFLHRQTHFMDACFQPIKRPFPQLMRELAAILEAVGKTNTSSAVVAKQKSRSFWRSLLAIPVADLERALKANFVVNAPALPAEYVRPTSFFARCGKILSFLPSLKRSKGLFLRDARLYAFANSLLKLASECKDYTRRVKDGATPPELLKPLLEPRGAEMLRSVFRLFLTSIRPMIAELRPLLDIVDGRYDILHFSGVNSIRYLYFFDVFTFSCNSIGWDVAILKRLGVKVVYSNVACFDGALQSSFRKWHPYPVCEICVWENSDLCNDRVNATWGELRNDLADYQINIGGNRVDYNLDSRVHEAPEFYCLDKDFWSPDNEIPAQFLLPRTDPDIVRLYHGVGNLNARTRPDGKNIKCTHIYVPLVESMRARGAPVELMVFTAVANKDVRWYQLQSDIFCDQLTYGWFGANAREGMMLGKPVICFLRPEWLDAMRSEVLEYVEELPIVNATPDTVESVLEDLVMNREKREYIGRKGREFAIKWHDRSAGARRVAEIYRELLASGRARKP